MIIGKGVTTNLNTYIDLLGIDREGNAAIIELKRGRTPREILAQGLEYGSFVERLTTMNLMPSLKNTRRKKVSNYQRLTKLFSISMKEKLLRLTKISESYSWVKLL